MNATYVREPLLLTALSRLTAEKGEQCAVFSNTTSSPMFKALIAKLRSLKQTDVKFSTGYACSLCTNVKYTQDEARTAEENVRVGYKTRSRLLLKSKKKK